jgi:hypothetical protein
MKLRRTHYEQLLTYFDYAEGEGWYYGNKEQFVQRHNELKEWLEDLLKKADRIADLEKQVGIWEKEAMQARIKTSLYQSEIKGLRADLAKYDRLAWDDLKRASEK